MLLDHLDGLENAGLIRLVRSEPELEYLFRHTLVQEAAYATLLKEDRRRLHGAVGRLLERLYPDQVEELAATLAHHFSLAEDHPQALRYLILAGDIAFHRYAVREAIAHYTGALAVARQIGSAAEVPWQRLYQNLGRALELDTQYRRAIQVYEEMDTLARARGDRAMELVALTERAKVLSTPSLAHDAAAGQSLAEQALALARELGDRPAEARIEWVLLIVEQLRGDAKAALAHGQRSLALARELELREQLAYTLQDLHRPLANLGGYNEAKAALEEARGLWRELNNLPLLADNLASTADLMISVGDSSPAFEFAEESWRVSQAIGNLWNQAFGRAMMGEIYRDRGEFGAALTALHEARELSERAGLVILTLRIYRRLAETYLELNALELARQMVERAGGSAEMDAELRAAFRIDALLILCHVELRAGREEAAAALLEEVERLRPTVFSLRLLTIALAQAELALVRGAYQQAWQVLSDLCDEVGDWLLLPGRLRLGLAQARALLGLGNLEEAVVLARQAEERARALGSRLCLWPALVVQGRGESLRRNAEAAAAAFAEARREVEAIAAGIGDAALRDAFLSRPDVRTLLDNI